MRKGKRTTPGIQAWLFALAVPAVALFMLFSLLPYGKMVARWPMGIGKPEVMAYQQLFDHRPGQHVEGHAEQLALTEEAAGKWKLTAGEDAAMATASPLTTGDEAMRGTAAIALDFQAASPFRGMTGLALVPADLRSLEALYAHAVADSLDITSPGITLVQLARNDGSPGPYLMQERYTPGRILQHAPVATALLAEDGTVPKAEGAGTMAGDTIRSAAGPLVRSDRFDTATTAALGLLACVEQRTDLLDGGAGALYDRVTGRVDPLYRMSYGMSGASKQGVLPTIFRQALSSARTEERINRLAARFHADSAAWAARFLSIDSAAVPVLAKGRNIGLVQAEVDHTREQFMQRLFHPSPAHFIGAPVAVPAQPTITLDPWLVQFRTQPDTLRFVRGKYSIDHDLVLPHGMAVVLERGARWFMAPGVSVVINGELHARGTDLNPVFIRPQNDAAPFGSIAVNGTGATRVRIRGLRISGGSDLWADGVRHGGMLSFLRAEVRMDKCSIGESYGDAAVSVRRGSLAMSDCYLAGAGHSFLDLAEVSGSVERCAFAQPGGSASAKGRSGAGLLSSTVLLRQCSFTELPFAAVRAGRASKVMVTAGQFTGNATAIEATDGSSVYVDGCDFTGNGKVYVLRREHLVLGGSTLTAHANTMAGNGTEQEVDAASKVETVPVLDPKVWRIFNARP